MKQVSPDRWIVIEALLDKAFDVDADKQEAFVRKEAGSDVDLAKHVLKMLSAGEKAATFMESSDRSKLQDVLANMAASVKEDETEVEERRMVGPYRLVRKLGRGGMGQVYLAVRDDEAFKRYVALKVIRKGMDSEDILKRFKMERHILASLTHPNIARLLDGGVNEDGQSYFVMEYVDGEPIDKYCDEHRLSVEERLRLFEKVASAVHYAHQNLVVHRDLKPGNILVTSGGDVKLLDFGIAKFLNPDLTGYTLPMTKTEVRVMTPEYASPEQVRGNSVTTSSDVYQLGILLYELLTGHRPFSFETRARGEIEKIILEKPPEKPSTMISRVEERPKETLNPEAVSHKRRTPLERLRKQLSGDLDHIVLMALRKETDRRYQSADQLLKDLENYRLGRPVSAQSDTFRYRSTRFIQRNKLAVSAGIVVAVVLVALTLGAFRFAYITGLQRDQIAVEAQKTEQVKDFLLDLFVQANPEFNNGVDPTAHDLLQKGAASITERLSGEPAIQSEMMYTIALAYADLGYYEEARPLMERSLEIERELAGDSETSGLAQSLYGLGYLEDELEEYDAAVEHLSMSYEMRMRLFGEKNLETAESLNDLAAAWYTSRGLPADTLLILWNRVLDARMELLPADHKDIIETLTNIANVHLDMGNIDLAESTFGQTLGMIERSLSKNHPFYASNVYNLGTAKYDLGEFVEAEALFREAMAVRARLYGEESDPVANSMNWIGRSLIPQGRFEEAESLLIASKDLHAKVLGSNAFTVARDYSTLGRLYETTAAWSKARSAYAQAVAIARISAPPFHPAGFNTWISLARVQQREGAFAAAVSNLLAGIDFALEDWTEDDVDIASARLSLAECYTQMRDYTKARTQLDVAESYFSQQVASFPDEMARIEAVRANLK